MVIRTLHRSKHTICIAIIRLRVLRSWYSAVVFAHKGRKQAETHWFSHFGPDYSESPAPTPREGNARRWLSGLIRMRRLAACCSAAARRRDATRCRLTPMERRTLGKTLCHATYKGMCGSGLNALRRAMNALHVSQGKRCPNPLGRDCQARGAHCQQLSAICSREVLGVRRSAL
jgi:hypothetical protein